MAVQNRRQDIPKPLVQGRKRFRAWRRTRKLGTRIPERLWDVAVRLAVTHGLNRTASVLGLDYYSLKKRVDSTDSDEHSSASTFVELSMPPLATSGECVIELEDVAGARMRVHLKGHEVPDLVAFSHSFWNAD